MSVGYTRGGFAGHYIGMGSAVYQLSISPVSGDTSVTSTNILGRTLVLVARTGIIYKETTETPTGREYRFTKSTGEIEFGIAFNDDEDVIVNYR